VAGRPRFFVDVGSPYAWLAAERPRRLKAALRARTDAAIALGVRGVPTVLVGDQAFWGDERLEDAARALRD
jgi:2-hydroxychromene-2-carboxylate isomerase